MRHAARALSLALISISNSQAAPPMLGGCQIFPANHIFNTRIDKLPVDPHSAAYINTISTGTRYLHMDLGQSEDMTSDSYWGIPFNVVSGSRMPWQKVSYIDGWPDESDCAGGDHGVVSPCTSTPGVPLMPIPASPMVEGGISGDQSIDGDHHLLVLDTDTCRLWENYHAYTDASGGWDVLSTAQFDLHSTSLRPAGWTSTDAAGFPLMPLLLKANEAGSGQINHALRFSIQSSKIRNSYIWPARHYTNNGDGSTSKPPMGQLFRLKASYVIPADSPVQAKAILTAMKQYGMYIADGGSDMYVQGDPNANWDSNAIDAVQSVPHSAFEAVDITAITSRPAFDPDSAAVPPAMGAFAIVPVVSGNAGSLTLSANISAASADQGKPGQLYIAAYLPSTGKLYSLTGSGWQTVEGLALLPYANVTLGTHSIPITKQLNISSLAGLKVYAGYGLDLNDMISGAKYGELYGL